MSTKIKKFKSIKNLFDSTKSSWFEDVYWSVRIFFDNLRWKIYYFFYPQHENIRKAIPTRWADLDSIVENVLCAVLISFVEEEKGLEQITMMDYSFNSNDEIKTREFGSVDLFWNYYNSRYSDYKRLEEIYNWIKVGRASMQRYIDAIYSREDYLNFSDDIDIAENRLHEKDTECLVDIVKLRKYLWT
jgi:hypothetical protein